MKVGIVTFPGTVDASDVAKAVHAVGGEPVTLTHMSDSLDGIDAVVLPGGASFSDHLRPGALARHTPVMTEVIAQAREGLPVLGIGNGFQILCESRLLPGALTTNASGEFISAEQSLRVETRDTVWTNQFESGEEITIVLKSGSGSYIATPEVLERLESSDQVVFRYVGSTRTGRRTTSPASRTSAATSWGSWLTPSTAWTMAPRRTPTDAVSSPVSRPSSTSCRPPG